MNGSAVLSTITGAPSLYIINFTLMVSENQNETDIQ